MKKLLFISLFGLVCSSCFSTSITTTNPSSSPAIDDSKYQMIIDNRFEHGFDVSPGSGSNPDTGWFPEERWTKNVDICPTQGDTPIWMLSQHGDIYSLNDHYNKYGGDRYNTTVPDEDGYYTFYDESKKVSVNPSKGACYLELNTSQEYERPRKSGEQWCHILLNEGFQKAVQVKEIDECILTIDLTMKKFEDHMNGLADSSLHATQFLMYLVMKSNNPAEDSGFFWFGIPFFDNRYPNGLPESGMIDAGGAGATSKFIYSMPSADYMEDKTLILNKTCSIEVDIKPYILNGLILAQEKGFFLNSTFEDLCFQSMNIGFEIPGTYDCGIEMSNFSLTAYYTEE